MQLRGPLQIPVRSSDSPVSIIYGSPAANLLELARTFQNVVKAQTLNLLERNANYDIEEYVQYLDGSVAMR